MLENKHKNFSYSVYSSSQMLMSYLRLFIKRPRQFWMKQYRNVRGNMKCPHSPHQSRSQPNQPQARLQPSLRELSATIIMLTCHVNMYCLLFY